MKTKGKTNVSGSKGKVKGNKSLMQPLKKKKR